MKRVLVILAVLGATSTASAEPKGAHPRLIVDDAMKAAWKKQASDKKTAVYRAIAFCDDVHDRPKEFVRDYYMGLNWAQNLNACLIAWMATGKDDHAKTAMIYFKANLDDLDNVGDGKGGDNAARRDSGFAMRAMGPSTALAYDWLADHKDMTADLKKKARQRFEAWTSWYLSDGYRARYPGSNYHAGYLIAATMIAIAQGGEAGREGTALWALVKDELWGRDMETALEPGGILEGGDWGEGWQYAPLAVAEYALAAREMKRQGVTIPNIEIWLEAILKHNVYSRSPGGGVFVNGDTDHEYANLKPRYLAFATPLVGDATEEVWAWSKAEVALVGVTEDEFPLYAAIAETRTVEAVDVPRATWPTTYLAAGTGTFYARTHWGDDAVWMVTSCVSTVETDHFHADAGNVVLSRGPDDLIVDPSPYGTLSTMTSNAPSVVSGQLPADYIPSQAFWSEKTRYIWARQTTTGIVAARCDYADQYKFQDTPSDIPLAIRDLVLLPYDNGNSAALVVIDRAKSGAKDRPLHLRFRTQAKLKQDGNIATGTRGESALTINRAYATGGEVEVRRLAAGNCWGEELTRGNCDVPRFAVDEMRLVVPGPSMLAIHVIDVGDATHSAPEVTGVPGADGFVVTRDFNSSAVVMLGKGVDLTYTAPAGSHVIVDAPQSGGKTNVTATITPGGDNCKVTVSATGTGTSVNANPVVVTLDKACAVVEDVTLPGGPEIGDGEIGSGSGSDLGLGSGDDPDIGDGSGSGLGGSGNGGSPRTVRTGCCGASATLGSPLAMSAVVLLGLLAMRRRR